MKMFLDVFLFLFLIACLKKLDKLGELPTADDFLYIVITSLILGKAMDIFLVKVKKIQSSEQ